jgi:hypothetical protein
MIESRVQEEEEDDEEADEKKERKEGKRKTMQDREETVEKKTKTYHSIIRRQNVSTSEPGAAQLTHSQQVSFSDRHVSGTRPPRPERNARHSFPPL